MYGEAILIPAVAGSFIAGLVAARVLIKKSALIKKSDIAFSARIQLLGEIPFTPLPRRKGIFIKDTLEMKRNMEELKRFLDTNLMLRYAKEFRINYIGLEGDREDGSWSPHRLAFCSTSNTYKGGYNIYLNPDLDVQEVSLKLSWELETAISSSDVYPFLFLHEVGHTTRAGNQDFYTAVVNHAFSGERRSSKRKGELISLKSAIEHFADRFALRELPRWKERDPAPQ